ncbi:centrosomal protein of 126 kDa isoform X1 [Paramisgurnus dabryanus]|uniref:centrosomal protein of 126 kDa isoform X1 n=1 Tax=Paramisgurnus dabryanus TaxID=90735 RepID=UPI003CCFDDEF
MPALKDKLHYSLGSHRDTGNDRELLVQERRYCRSLARKLSLETNRRRKALEEKRKQWDVQEQRLRENVLKQRRQKLQDATENFQRAHLPPSQRSRPAFKRRAPNLDEALNHIQGTSHLYNHQSPFLSSGSIISSSRTSSPKPPGGARHLRALSAAEAYSKLMHEKTFKNNQLLFFNEIVHEEKEQDNVQEYLDTSHSETESLSSLDSLENGAKSVPNPVSCSYQNTNYAQTFTPLMDPSKLQDPHSSRQSNNLRSPPSYPVVKSFLEELLIEKHNLNPSLPSPSAHESANGFGSLQNLTKATEQCNLRDQSQIIDTQSAFGCQKELIQQDFVANSEHMTHYNDRNDAQENILKDKASVVAHCKTQTVPDATPLEFSNLKTESKVQTQTLEEKYSKHSSEWQTALPASRGEHNDGLFETFAGAAAHLVTIPRTDQVSDTQCSSESHKHKPDVNTAAGLKRESKPLIVEESVKRNPPDPKNETEIIKLATACMSKSFKNSEQSAEPVTHLSPNSANVRFLKGILKNHLKTKSGNVKHSYTPSHLLFTKEVAILIRDSVELARAKINEPERNRTIKKKLRWFDEVNRAEGEDVDRVFKDPSKQTFAKSGHQQTHKQFSPDHQPGLHGSHCVNLLTGVSKNIFKTSSAPAGSTQQAWADVGPQESRTQEPTSQKGGPWTPRRVRSARAGSGSVTSRARKGTIIRPQSAREAQHVAKSQGKIFVPHPPPKPEVDFAESTTKAAYGDDGVQSKPGVPVDPALYRDSPDSQTITHQPILKADKDAFCTAVPPYHTHTQQTASKGACFLSPPNAFVENARRRCGENGICLDRTPTDEEITLLWHGVRSALASKEGDPQSFLAHNGLLSASPQACASLSHVTINGDSLISGVKGVSRLGGFFLSSSNVRSPIRRQLVESNMVKNRAATDSSRNQTGGIVQRKNNLLYQVTVPKTPHPDKNNAVDNGEVTDGGHDAVAWVQSHRTYNAPTGPQNLRSLSINTLTLEEQKILHSLERLNQRLQYVKDTAGGNPAVKGIFNLAPVFNQPGENVGVAVRRRVVSADNRTQTQRY